MPPDHNVFVVLMLRACCRHVLVMLKPTLSAQYRHVLALRQNIPAMIPYEFFYNISVMVAHEFLYNISVMIPYEFLQHIGYDSI